MATYGSNLPDGCNPADWWYEPPEPPCTVECDACGCHYDMALPECPFCQCGNPEYEDGEGES